ncbi:expressed unknown protein [Seminavis robusta]|uniref:Uncharacterized protein n=1 Tax=Seminavis robusta TaxID=568900 RepID=A0A9N8HGL1_9STRA|nr:expressed unknown protein [Seminavis robusta]|eukprot:Sro403_g135720.1 n/a (115) ;mRNA; f:46652-46996
MCAPTSIPATPTPLPTMATTKSRKSVSFSTDEVVVVTVERLDLAFYSAVDFARFREEILDEREFKERYAKKQHEARRQRGYSMMGAKRLQRNREGRHSKQSIHTMRNHAQQKVQ